MVDINQIITTNFQNNIQYFEKRHPLLFQKLSAYENAVENAHYQEQYALLFENGDFDLYNKKTQNYLYKKEPQKFVSALTQSSNFSRNDAVFIAAKELEKEPKNHEMASIEKFIFFGVANATHLEKITKKLSPKVIFIVEDDLELFYLSLMSLDYAKLAKNRELYFSIFEDEKEFKRSATLFLEAAFFHNHYIKFLQHPSFSEEKLKLFHTHIATQSHFLFSYNSILEQYLKPLKRIEDGFFFLNIINTSLPKIPLLLIAPGPSLTKQLAWIKRHQKSFLLLALSATLPILEKHNIKPDIITHMDGFSRSKKHFDALASLSFVENTPLLFSARTPIEILKMFHKKDIFLFENGTSFKDNFGNFSTFCAGSASYLLSLVLHAEEIYLLGLDLAVDQESFQTHADSYVYNLQADKKESQTLSFRDSLIQTKGNFQKSVATTPNFALSISAIDEITQGLKSETQQLFNCNNGAAFEDIAAKEIEDIEIKKEYDKEELRATLLTLFREKSEDSLSKKERENLHKQREYATKVDSFLEQILQKEIDSKMALERVVTTIITELNNENETLDLIMQTYLKTETPKLFDLINIEKEKEIKAPFEKLVRNLLTITRTYIKGLNG